MYAEARIREYWIVNLQDRVLEVYREPEAEAYRTVLRLRPEERVAPLAASASWVRIADLLP
jgi:Uma2 family endonuclease